MAADYALLLVRLKAYHWVIHLSLIFQTAHDTGYDYAFPRQTGLVHWCCCWARSRSAPPSSKATNHSRLSIGREAWRKEKTTLEWQFVTLSLLARYNIDDAQIAVQRHEVRAPIPSHVARRQMLQREGAHRVLLGWPKVPARSPW